MNVIFREANLRLARTWIITISIVFSAIDVRSCVSCLFTFVIGVTETSLIQTLKLGNLLKRRIAPVILHSGIIIGQLIRSQVSSYRGAFDPVETLGISI